MKFLIEESIQTGMCSFKIKYLIMCNDKCFFLMEFAFVIHPGEFIEVIPKFACLCYPPIQGPVFQSLISLTSSLRSQLVNCFMTL